MFSYLKPFAHFRIKKGQRGTDGPSLRRELLLCCESPIPTCPTRAKWDTQAHEQDLQEAAPSDGFVFHAVTEPVSDVHLKNLKERSFGYWPQVARQQEGDLLLLGELGTPPSNGGTKVCMSPGEKM